MDGELIVVLRKGILCSREGEDEQRLESEAIWNRRWR